METRTPRALISAAKAFAKKKHGGIPARTRTTLDELRPGIAILVNERLSLADIQEFCRQEKGFKIGITALRQYCQEHFNYPTSKKRGVDNDAGT